MKKALFVIVVLFSAMSVFAQSSFFESELARKTDPKILELIRQNKQDRTAPTFNFDSSPYNLPDAVDLADPQCGQFNEDVPWLKDFSRHIDNPGGNQITLSIVGSEHFIVTQPEPGNPLLLRFQPQPANWYGSELLIITLTTVDGKTREVIRAEDAAVIRINVASVPDPPLWSNLPAGNIFQTPEETALLIDFRQFVDCVDSPPDSFDLFIAPAEFPITVSQEPGSNGHLVTFTPHLDYFGIATYQVTAVDRYSNALSSQEIHIHVTPVNDPPQVTGTPDTDQLYLDLNESVQASVIATDPDGDELTYAWLLNGELISTGTSVDYVFTQPGYFNLVCNVSDGTATVSISWSISVRPAGPGFDPAFGTYTSPIYVTISVPAGFEGATINYTTDGNTPSADSPVYSGPILVESLADQEHVVTILASYTHPDYPTSAVWGGEYRITGTVSDPVILPSGGLYYTPVELSISSSNTGAAIYYTLNGEDPQAGDPGTYQYTGPFMLPGSGNITVKAQATRADWLPSAVVQELYQITGTVEITSHTMTPPPLPDGEFYLVEPGESVAVTIADLALQPADAVLYYTLDNSLPGPDNPNAYIYTPGSSIQFTNPTWISFKAYLNNWLPSQTVSYYYDVRTRVKVNTFANGTVFDPAPGLSTTPVNVSISTNTAPAGASIYYSLDGGDPDELTGTPYTEAISLFQSTTVKIIAYYPGLYPSVIHSGYFEITGTVAAPVFDPLPDNYDSPLDLSMSCSTPLADIYYSLDGSEPAQGSPSSFLYTGPVALGVGEHFVRARAFKANWDPSPISEGQYNISVLPPPVFDLPEGLYYEPIVVHLSVPTVDDASIYYTTDGTDPTQGSNLYNPSLGIPVGAQTTMTIKAISVKTGWATSAVSQREYRVTGTVATPGFNPDGGVFTTAVSVIISSSTPDAVIRYTLDGQDPSMEYGSTYEAPLTISSSATLKARAYKTDWLPSEIHGAVYTIFGNIAEPEFTPGAGTYTAPVEVYISVNPPDASVYYTTNGSTPSESNGTLYVAGNPILISEDTLLKAAAFKTGWNPSSIASAQYVITGMVSSPVFSPGSGQYGAAQTVTISVNPPQATIVYTLDGSEPTLTNGTVYSGPLTIETNTIVKAFAWLEGWDPSPVAVASYVINGAVGTPVISPAAGYYNTQQQISITAYPTTATIRYTLDGSVPSADNGAVYSGPFTISQYTMVRAYAYLDNWLDSDVAMSEYFFVTANPVITPPSGTYADAQVVTIGVATAGASIRYTLDGSEPTATYGLEYSGPFTVSASGTVKAIAYRTGWISSNVVTNTYLINGPVADPVFSVPGGDYFSSFSVGITVSPMTASIYYTLDGSEPSNVSGILYTAPIEINENTVVKARAYLANWLPSNVSSVTYNLHASPVSFNPQAGSYTTALSVQLSTVTPGATISYTLDGSIPVPGVSAEFDPANPIHLTDDATVRAIASKPNWFNSQVTSAVYVIDIPLPTVATPQILPPSGVYVTPQTITITTATAGASIYYTTDNTEPSPVNGMVYTGGFVISDDAIIKAKAFLDGYNPSLTSTAQYIIAIPVETVATPQFDPPAGIYNQPVDVVITTATPGATIRYTIDGTEPSAEIGTLYSGPVNITETATVKAIAFKTGMNNSLISNASYVINIVIPTVAAPMFSHPSGTYQEPISLTLSSTTADASIRYTTDGTDPSPTQGILYGSPIVIPGNSSLFIKAIAYKDGWLPSSIVSANYNVTGSVAAVQFSIPGGIYTSAQTLVLSTSTAGASIRYTTNGADPTETSQLYSLPIQLPLNSQTTVKARAYRQDWTPSPITQNTYTITGQVQIAAPQFSVPAGTYTSQQVVSIGSPQPAGAVVRYTIDGTDPTEASTEYAEPIVIPLNSTLTLKARAYLENWLPSPVYSASYQVTGQVILPAVLFNPQPGIYQTAQMITLNPAQLPTDAVLRYTLDGSEPSQNSPAYQNPITLPLNSLTTIIVKGFRADWIPSETAQGTFQITGQVAINQPVFSPAPGVYTTAQSITINTAIPSDAQIRYTTDGNDPTEASTLYSGPIQLALNSNLTLKVRAFKANWTPSPVYTGVYSTTGSVSIVEPVFTPAPGTYSTPQLVSINTTTLPANGVIRYTTNGSDPTESSPVYSAPISVGTGSSVTIKARAYLANWTPSPVYTGVYTVTGQVTITEPVFTPAGGTFTTAISVTINTSTNPANATIRYTTDGSEPNSSSAVYSAPIQVNQSTTIKAKAFHANWQDSETYTASYVITGQVAIAEPVFTPAAGTYTTAQSLVINGNVVPNGAQIRYTLDGSTPSTSSPLYSAPIQLELNTNYQVRVRAFATGWDPSPVYSANYQITGTVEIPEPVFTPAAGTYTSEIQVVLNTQTLPSGATLHYTISSVPDGQEPDEGTPVYTQPIQLYLNSNNFIKVKAFKTGWTPSPTYTAQYIITGQVQIIPPYLTPAPGVYTSPQTVSTSGLTSPSGGTIRYTVDGSTPMESSPVFDTPIQIGLNTVDFTIKVRAFKDGYIPSNVHTGVYTVTGQVQLAQAPFTPGAGIYQTAQTVTIAAPILPAQAVLRYTTDGSEPSELSPAYVAPINLPLGSVTTIKVRGFAQDWLPSETAEAQYTITGTVATPLISPPGGEYATPQSVTISCPTQGVLIRYTLDGSDPTESSALYEEPIIIGNYETNKVVKARAFKQDWIPSAIASETYSVLPAPISVSAYSYSGYIRLLWDIPNQSRALQGFNVYRRRSTETGFAKLNTAPVNSQMNGLYYYNDYDIDMNVTYEYRITAVYDGQESPPSQVVTEFYQSAGLEISAVSCAYPNPAVDNTTIRVVLNRNQNVQVSITIYDFAGKKINSIMVPAIDNNLIERTWDLCNSNGIKVGRGTYFARVVANDNVNRAEHVIKIAVK